MIRTIVGISWVVLSTIIGGTLVLLTAQFTRNGNVPHNIGQVWARLILFVCGVKLNVEGSGHLKKDQAYIFMPNHQSMVDIPVIFVALTHQFRWVAKVELFKIPIFGSAMKRCGYISIDRTNRKAAFASLKEAIRKISRGTSVLIFPEGTRSDQGVILPFKKGGFVMAVEAKAQVVPVVITGTRAIMTKGRLRISPGKVNVKIYPPIAAGNYTRKTTPLLLEEVKTIITDGYQNQSTEVTDA